MEYKKARLRIDSLLKKIETTKTKIRDVFCRHGVHEWELMSEGPEEVLYHCFWCGDWKREEQTKSLIHAIIECKECGWHAENYLTAQKEAANHNKETGHLLKGDLGYMVEYGAKERRKA